MRRVCAWCSHDLEASDGSLAGPVSHGICDACREQLYADEGVSIFDFLSSLPVPALLIDEERRIGVANREAVAAAGQKTGGEIFGTRVGLVYECAHALEEGDCGLSIHCTGCVIRQSVDRTFRTGIARERVPATLKRLEGAAPIDVAAWISTRRVGGRVLVQIDVTDAGGPRT